MNRRKFMKTRKRRNLLNWAGCFGSLTKHLVIMKNLLFVCSLFLLHLVCQSTEQTESRVKIWEEPVTLPTYLVDDPDLNPRFYEGRAYQGAQGRVYPYPIYESLLDTRIEKAYDMVFLENEYIKIEVLPEIGGRLFGAQDKTNGYDFVYKQHVIKPGLIGMLGAWISGGIEWNFPHHHRVTAYMPVDYVMQENPDGSATVWIGELELRHRMKFMLGISVYPGKSYFEVTFKPFNRTPFVHSFLYFANTGVHTNEQYQVIFPPSTKFGTYHGKNQFINWPISHEIYNRVDYTAGVDVSWWKNHPEWTSIFAWNDTDDFLAGYDHGKYAGTVCLSNHHIAPGKKFWTWSTGPRGKLWDEALTETDGPELELMIGGYSDNQPDYSWLQPYESKYLKQYWYPVREIGGVKNANINAAVNLDFLKDQEVKIGFYATSEQKGAKVSVFVKGEKYFEELIDINPDRPFIHNMKIPANVEKEDIKVALFTSNGNELVSYQPQRIESNSFREVAKPPRLPEEIKTIEKLYYTGQRLEQFYNPSLKPEPYYQEALKRDPQDYRVNTAMGILYLRKAMFDKAENYLKTAVSRITDNYTKPRDGEAYYYLGICQKYMGDLDEAYKNLYKATWSQAFHSAAYYHLAELSCINQNYSKALEHLDRSLTTNAKNTKAINLKAAILRKSGNTEKALELATSVMEYDPLDFWSDCELYFIRSESRMNEKAEQAASWLRKKMHGYEQSYLELSLDYANAGLLDEAIRVLAELYLEGNDQTNSFPMIYYYLGYYWLQKGDETKALEYFKTASEQSSDYCFPFRLESIHVLAEAIRINRSDSRAPYYLGNLLYEMQPERAIKEWEKSRTLDDEFALVHRNLGMAYYRTNNNTTRAIESYLKSITLNTEDQRLLYEIDLIYAADREVPETRLKLLQKHHNVIANNNVSDALSREIMLLVQLGYYDKALEVLTENYFKQWEGVSKAYNSFVDAHLLRGLNYYHSKNYRKALEDFIAAGEFPANMMVAKPYRGGRSGEVYYYIGTGYEALGKNKEAKEQYHLCIDKRLNNELSDNHYYKALALDKLGRDKEALEIFDGLISLGNKRINSSEVDFFAKFGERQTHADRLAEAYYILGLAYLGKGLKKEAEDMFSESVRLNLNHVWATNHLSKN